MGSRAPGTSFPPRRSRSSRSNSKLERNEGGAEVTKLAESGQLNYQLDGVADFGIAKVPIHLSGLVSFGKKGEHQKPKPSEDAPAKPADDQ